MTQQVREGEKGVGRKGKVGPRSLATKPSSAPVHPATGPPAPAHLCNTSRLEGEGRLPLLSPPGPAILAVTHNGVDVSMHIEARVEVQAHIVVIFAQVQREARG